MKGCDRTQMGFTECLIHKSSLLSLSLGALDALPTEEADRFTNVSVINCGFYFDLHQQIGEWTTFTPEQIKSLSFSAITNDSDVIKSASFENKINRPLPPCCASPRMHMPVTRMNFQDVASH